MSVVSTGESVSVSQAKRWIKEKFPPDLPLFLWGPPGIGKSTIVREIAEEEGIGFLDVRLSTIESVDLRGFPTFDEKTGLGTYRVFQDLLPNEEIHGKRGILFLDEFNQANTDVMKAAFQLILDRSVGQYRLPDGWRVIAAGNRPEDAPGLGLQPLPYPLSNRFLHIAVRPPQTKRDIDDLAVWYMDHETHPSVIAFLRWKPDAIFNIEDAQKSPAWPSPRSWHFASKTLIHSGYGDVETGKVTLRKGNRDFREDIVSLLTSCVGMARAREFVSFCEVYQEVPDPNVILSGGKYSINPKRPDVVFATSNTLMFYMRGLLISNRLSDEHVANFSRFLEKIGEENGMYCLVVCAKTEPLSKIVKHPQMKYLTAERRKLLSVRLSQDGASM